MTAEVDGALLHLRGEPLRLAPRTVDPERRDERRLVRPRVLARRLAERLRVTGDVEDVVDRLERAAERFAVRARHRDASLVRARGVRAELRRGRQQRSRLLRVDLVDARM